MRTWIWGTVAILLNLAMPSAAPAADLVIDTCDTAKDVPYCQYTRTKIQEQLLLAKQGDYQARRNVGYCLSSGCDGAVVIDKVEACAWRIVVMNQNSADAGVGDRGNFDLDCGRLSANDRRAADARVKALTTR